MGQFEFKTEVVDGSAKISVENEKAFVEAAKAEGIEKKTLEEVAGFQKKYLNDAVDAAVAEVEKVMIENKDVNDAVVVVPFGTGKSQKITTNVTRSATFRVPGTDNSVTKPVIKVAVTNDAYSVPKARLKKMEQALKEKVL